MTVIDRTTESAAVFEARLKRMEVAPPVDIAADVAEAVRERVLDAMSWAETFDDGRIGREGAERLLAEYDAALVAMPPADETIDVAHLARQAAWSSATFGPGSREKGVSDHIRKELIEVADATDPAEKRAEWIDVVILALDGAWRSGLTPEQIVAGVKAKQAINEARPWPDWRTADPDKAIEHDRSSGGTS